MGREGVIYSGSNLWLESSNTRGQGGECCEEPYGAV